MLPPYGDRFTREDTEDAGDPVEGLPSADDVAGTVTFDDTEEVGEDFP